MLSCGLSIEEEEEQLRLHETYFEFADEKAYSHRITFEKARAEGTHQSFFNKFNKSILEIDSSLNATYKKMDSYIKSEETNEFDEAISMYNSSLSMLENAFEDLVEDYDEKPYRSN